MSKRKYRQGRKLSLHEAIDAIADGKFIYMRHKIYHSGWSRSWQVSMLISACNKGVIMESIKVQGEGIE